MATRSSHPRPKPNRGTVQYDDMKTQAASFAALVSLIEEAQTICVCAHTSPDGDALGSGLALAHILRRRWPEKTVTNLLADADPVPRIYAFLPGADGFVQAKDYEGAPDLFISVDLPAPSRLNEAEAVLRRAPKVAEIDHHPSEKPFGDVHVVRPDAAATGVIIAEFAQHIEAEMTPEIADCLFCAIMTDTGRFQYQNANPEAFDIASYLVDYGANPSNVSLHVYQSFRLQYLHLEAMVMSRIKTFLGGRISYSYSTVDDLERTGAQLDECDGLIDVVRSVDGAEVALFLKELPGGGVRGNLRSKSDYDISVVARELGGGGHKAAAGFTLKGDLDEALSVVLPRLKALLTNEPCAPAMGGVSE